MSSIDTTEDRGEMMPPLPVYLNARAAFANSFLIGEGIEIGPLHQPLAVPPHAHVRYVDRMSTPDLRREYPELVDWDLTETDIIDNGEKLEMIPAGSQDFIVANHFLEHTEDPIGTIENHLGKLKPGGILFYAVPDKRFTFDFRRPVTPIEHMLADHEEGPERSRADHYREWCSMVIDGESPSAGTAEQAAFSDWVGKHAEELEAQSYSIHMHVWTQAEFLRLILTLRDRAEGGFDLEAAARVGIEFIVVLRKAGPLPEPRAVGSQPAFAQEAGALGKRALRVARSQVRRWRAKS
jgi:SAM-dependent methyltransferase